MKPLENIRLVALREIQVRARSRAFRLSTLFIVALIVIGIGGSRYIEGILDGFFETSYTIGIVDADAPALRTSLIDVATQLDRELDVVVYETADTARSGLDDEEADAILLEREVLHFRDAVDDELAAIANQAVRTLELPRQLEELGLTPEQLSDLLQVQRLETSTLGEADDTEDGASYAVATFAAILLFISIMTYGQWVLHGVVEEKATRVIEILLSTIRPYQLLAGKVLGIIALAGMQLAVLLATAVVMVIAFADFEVPRVAAFGIFAAALWFLLGLVLYGFIYGCAGALISRQEDASNVTMPFVAVLTLGYMFTVFGAVNAPDGALARVLSLVPLTAPLAMPTRVAFGEVGIIEFILGVALTVLAILFVVALGGRIYAGAVLRVGPRVALRDAWRLGR